MSASRDPISEIERLLDELEGYSEKTPFLAFGAGKIIIPDDHFFTLLGRIRESLPLEIKQSRETLEKRDFILQNAQEEHRRILDSAEKRLDDMLSQDQIVIAARREAEKILERAAQEGDRMRSDALGYTAQVLTDLEKQFAEALATVRRGREYVEKQSGGAGAPNQPQVVEQAQVQVGQ